MSAPASPLGLFVGLTTVDVQYRVRAVPRPDMGVEADDSLIAPGGPSYTASASFSVLGGHAICASAAGAGPLKPLVLADAAAYGVEYHDCAAPGSRLAFSSILTDTEGRRTIISSDLASAADAARLQLPKEEPSIIPWDGFHPALVDRGADTFPSTPVLLDGGRWLDSLESRLDRITWAVVSERLRVPGAPADAAGTIEALRRAGCAAAAVTRGQRAVLADAGDGFIREIPPPKRGPIVDTLGAGDILHGAIAVALARRATLLEAIAAACIEATASCSVFGTRAWRRARQLKRPA